VRAPSPSFKSELAAYRKWLDSHRECFENWEHDLALQVLARWQRRAEDGPKETDDAWIKIKSTMVPADLYTAGEFIALVLERRVHVEALKTNVLLKEPYDEAEFQRFLKQHLEIGGDDASFARAAHDRRLRRALRNLLFSRDGKTAARERFMADFCNKFTEVCGQPHYEIVAYLTVIAFDIEVTAEAVRLGVRRDAKRRREVLQLFAKKLTPP